MDFHIVIYLDDILSCFTLSGPARGHNFFENKSFLNKYFFLRAILSKEKSECWAGLELHPLQSGRVPLPLDHLHSMLSPCLNSYPRALTLCSLLALTLIQELKALQ